MKREPERVFLPLGVPAYHNVAANEAWCKGCGGRVFEIMDKIWRVAGIRYNGLNSKAG
jgi:hypothetical protein